MSEPRYAQLARELADGIASGRFPVGSVLPTEFELCDLYDASRHTVRAAIKELQDQGLVSRRKKLGTRVEASTPIVRGYVLSLATLELVQSVLLTYAPYRRSPKLPPTGLLLRSSAPPSVAAGCKSPACAMTPPAMACPSDGPRSISTKDTQCWLTKCRQRQMHSSVRSLKSVSADAVPKFVMMSGA